MAWLINAGIGLLVGIFMSIGWVWKAISFVWRNRDYILASLILVAVLIGAVYAWRTGGYKTNYTYTPKAIEKVQPIKPPAPEVKHQDSYVYNKYQDDDILYDHRYNNYTYTEFGSGTDFTVCSFFIFLGIHGMVLILWFVFVREPRDHDWDVLAGAPTILTMLMFSWAGALTVGVCWYLVEKGIFK